MKPDAALFLAARLSEIVDYLKNHAAIEADAEAQRHRLDQIQRAADQADRLILKDGLQLEDAATAAALAHRIPADTIRLELTRRDQSGKCARLALAHKEMKRGQSIRSTARRLNIPKSTLHDRSLSHHQKNHPDQPNPDQGGSIRA